MVRRPPRSTLFPTRRSSDLCCRPTARMRRDRRPAPPSPCSRSTWTDRKSTRLNSSHLVISNAVFCLKKLNVLGRCIGNGSFPVLPSRLEPPSPEIPLDPVTLVHFFFLFVAHANVTIPFPRPSAFAT